MVKKLDYCGLYSDSKVDKSALFEKLYGELQTAPMIKECPINIECWVVQIMECPVNTIFIGEVVTIYLEEDYLTEGMPDVSKIDLVLAAPDKSRGGKYGSWGYWKLGEYLAPAWEVGKDLKSDKENEAKP